MVRGSNYVSRTLHRENYSDIYGKKSLREVLATLHIREFTPTGDQENSHARINALAVGLAEDYGKQVLFRGPTLEVKSDTNRSYYGGDCSWQTFKHVFEKEKAVVEPELEIPASRGYVSSDYDSSIDPDGVLPFVRIFSLRTRTYLYTDVRNVVPYEYNTNILDRLVIEPEHRRILQDVFAADEGTIKDLIPGKTGGLCILAYGNPGVGKTLTAEIFAETKERPLYSLSVSEIGVTPSEIENNLQRVFTRVERWNAVLLFDECDVFLGKRGDDLKQSAVVGMFLRLMDFYTGTLFLTTNRFTVIDPAVDSRLMFRIHYRDLNDESRKTIWESLLREAKISWDPAILPDIVKMPFDGRKIRNFVRALQLRHVTELDMETIEKVKPYMVFEQF
jgi:hypothetical protein